MSFTKKIDDYLNGRLKGRELDEFENELLNNSELRKELAEYKRLHQIGQEQLNLGDKEMIPGDYHEDLDNEARADIEEFDIFKNRGLDPDMVDFKDRLKKAENELNETFPSTGQHRNIRMLWLLAAAVVVAVLAISVILLKPFSGRSFPDLYARYYEPLEKTEEILDLTRSNNSFLYAVEVFEAGEYERAMILFTGLLDDEVTGPYSRIYIGLCYMQLGEFDQAIVSFDEVQPFRLNELFVFSKWYTGLCYLKTGQSEQARNALSVVAEEDHPLSGKAERILRKME